MIFCLGLKRNIYQKDMSRFNKNIVLKELRKNKKYFNDKIIKRVCNGDCPTHCPLQDMPYDCSDIFEEMIPQKFKRYYDSNTCGNFLIYVRNNLLGRVCCKI